MSTEHDLSDHFEAMDQLLALHRLLDDSGFDLRFHPASANTGITVLVKYTNPGVAFREGHNPHVHIYLGTAGGIHFSVNGAGIQSIREQAGDALAQVCRHTWRAYQASSQPIPLGLSHFHNPPQEIPPISFEPGRYLLLEFRGHTVLLDRPHRTLYTRRQRRAVNLEAARQGTMLITGPARLIFSPEPSLFGIHKAYELLPV